MPFVRAATPASTRAGIEYHDFGRIGIGLPADALAEGRSQRGRATGLGQLWFGMACDGHFLWPTPVVVTQSAMSVTLDHALLAQNRPTRVETTSARSWRCRRLTA